MHKSIRFTQEALNIVEQYAGKNSCSFNKAVNDLIIKANNSESQQILTEELENFLGSRIKRIETGIIKLHKQLKIEGFN